MSTLSSSIPIATQPPLPVRTFERTPIAIGSEQISAMPQDISAILSIRHFKFAARRDSFRQFGGAAPAAPRDFRVAIGTHFRKIRIGARGALANGIGESWGGGTPEKAAECDP